VDHVTAEITRLEAAHELIIETSVGRCRLTLSNPR